MCQRILWLAFVLSMVLLPSASQAKTVRLDGPDARRAVQEVWNEEYQELAGHHRATIKVTDCYISDMPLPPDIKVKWMRIVQVIPQLRKQIDSKVIKLMSFADESLGRIPLGSCRWKTTAASIVKRR